MQRLVTLFTGAFLFLLSLNANAQCAMCRAAIETGGDNTQAEAVNDGIVYLMIFPYLLVGIVGFAIFRMYNKKKKPQTEANS
jgi:phosphatidylglycerophosphatase A